MNKKILSFLLLGLFLSGCVPSIPNKLPSELTTPTTSATKTVTPQSPTQTPSPSETATSSPTPDFTLVGLPVEQVGTVAFDFVAEACKAQWFTRGQRLSCSGDDTQADAGFVMQLTGQIQGLSSDLGVLLTFPPQTSFETISSKYPSFTVKKGDLFRAVLDCRAHSSCDVEFALDFYNGQAHAGLMHWRHLFADAPVVVDYSLDSIAGQTVQLGLAVYSKGNRTDGYAIWIAPHIHRPAP